MIKLNLNVNYPARMTANLDPARPSSNRNANRWWWWCTAQRWIAANCLCSTIWTTKNVMSFIQTEWGAHELLRRIDMHVASFAVKRVDTMLWRMHRVDSRSNAVSSNVFWIFSEFSNGSGQPCILTQTFCGPSWADRDSRCFWSFTFVVTWIL